MARQLPGRPGAAGRRRQAGMRACAAALLCVDPDCSRASGVDSICPRCQHRDAAAKSTESQTRARMGSTDGLINLSKGHPTEDLYAHAELSKAARAAADKMDSAEFSLDYGKEGASARFAAALSGLLAEEDAAATSPSAPSRTFDLSHRLFVTNGVSHALDVVAAVLARPGDRCLTEAATYFLVFAAYTRVRAHTMARSPLLCLALVTSYSPNRSSWRRRWTSSGRTGSAWMLRQPLLTARWTSMPLRASSVMAACAARNCSTFAPSIPTQRGTHCALRTVRSSWRSPQNFSSTLLQTRCTIF